MTARPERSRRSEASSLVALLTQLANYGCVEKVRPGVYRRVEHAADAIHELLIHRGFPDTFYSRPPGVDPRICPPCGGPKGAESRRCRACYRRAAGAGRSPVAPRATPPPRRARG